MTKTTPYSKLPTPAPGVMTYIILVALNLVIITIHLFFSDLCLGGENIFLKKYINFTPNG